MLETLLYTFFSFNIETLFPYWMEDLKFDWQRFHRHWGKLHRDSLVFLLSNLEVIKIINY